MLGLASNMISAVKGMHDLLGEPLRQWQWVERQFFKTLSDFGYLEVRTPVVERAEVFTQSVGEHTDIVQKQMYVFGREDERLALRPEGTAPFMRAVVEHNLQRLGGPQRYFYYGPMYRYERPQKGRQRQFYQFGAELILDETAEADAEIIILLQSMLSAIGVSAYTIAINSVGCEICREAYKTTLIKFFEPRRSDLCEDCQIRLERAPMRILDCKKPQCKVIAAKAPNIRDALCESCSSHHKKVGQRLKQTGVEFIEDPTIVRGLDYYSRTAFEFTSDLLGAQSAIAGGGRYDGLAKRFGAQPIPAVGFGLGLERVMLLVEELKIKIPSVRPCKGLFVCLGQEALDKMYPLATQMKRNGVWVEICHDAERSLKSQLKLANRVGAQYAVIVGENELQASQSMVKHLENGTQETVPFAQLEQYLKGGT